MNGMKRYAISPPPWRCDRRVRAPQFQLGIALRDKGRLDEAIDRQREALRLDPKNTMCRRELALVLKLKGKLDEAITEFREAIRLNPSSYTAHSNLSSVLEQQGRLIEAEAEAREAIRLRPELRESTMGGWA